MGRPGGLPIEQEGALDHRLRPLGSRAENRGGPVESDSGGTYRVGVGPPLTPLPPGGLVGLVFRPCFISRRPRAFQVSAGGVARQSPSPSTTVGFRVAVWQDRRDRNSDSGGPGANHHRLCPADSCRGVGAGAAGRGVIHPIHLRSVPLGRRPAPLATLRAALTIAQRWRGSGGNAETQRPRGYQARPSRWRHPPVLARTDSRPGWKPRAEDGEGRGQKTTGADAAPTGPQREARVPDFLWPF